VIPTTPEHPFFVRGKGWTATREVEVGDEVIGHDGQWVAVEAVEDTGRIETVYNLRVAQYHTYFVGSREWGFSVWAHNAECTIPPGAEIAPARRRARERTPLKVIKDAKGRKVGIFGKLQNNTDLHDRVVMQHAETLTATGRYKYITVNRGWKYATGEGSSKRPDVIGVRRNGKVDAWEVESPSDNPYLLHSRLTGPDGIRGIDENRRNIAGVLRPAGFEKHPNAINDMIRRGQNLQLLPVQAFKPR
jgi:hypothetical protein